jgi:hypothetical protein
MGSGHSQGSDKTAPNHEQRDGRQKEKVSKINTLPP